MRKSQKSSEYEKIAKQCRKIATKKSRILKIPDKTIRNFYKKKTDNTIKNF